MPWQTKFSMRILALLSTITMVGFAVAITWAMQPQQTNKSPQRALPGQSQPSSTKPAKPATNSTTQPTATFSTPGNDFGSNAPVLNSAAVLPGGLSDHRSLPAMPPSGLVSPGEIGTIDSMSRSVDLENVHYQVLSEGDKPETGIATKVIPFFFNVSTHRPERCETPSAIGVISPPTSIAPAQTTYGGPFLQRTTPNSPFLSDNTATKSIQSITGMLLALITDKPGVGEPADPDRFPIRVVVPVPMGDALPDHNMRNGVMVFGQSIRVSNEQNGQSTWHVHDIADSPHFATSVLEGQNFVSKPVSADDRTTLAKLVRLDVWIHASAQSLTERVENKEDLKQAETSLRGLLDEQYETLLERQKREVARLEERLGTLKAELGRRADAKERVVDVQLGKLILEAQGLMQ